MERFEQFRDRMTVLVYTGSSDRVGWAREEIARATLRSAVADLPHFNNVLFCDLDEFPSREQLECAATIDGPRAIPMDMFYRRANSPFESETPWLSPKASPVSTLPRDFTQFRWPEEPYSLIAGERGAHFSYMGFTAERVAEKVAAFSHSEFVFAMSEAKHLIRVSDGLALDHFGRSRLRGNGMLTVLPEPQWTDLHHWIHARRPQWFDQRSPGWDLWRQVNAAVIDDAMRRQDLDTLRIAGTWRSWRARAARIVLRSGRGKAASTGKSCLGDL